ncbi:MAG: hypothetical protein FWG43_01290 [Clostridiales bacterium]|nr:hypothetical protein [Clostridiales bacterium]
MSSEFYYAIMLGLLIGLVLGLLKTWLLWYVGNPFRNNAKQAANVQKMLLRSFLSYFSTIIILILVYLAALYYIPLPIAPLLLAAAAGVLACSLIYPLQNMFRK